MIYMAFAKWIVVAGAAVILTAAQAEEKPYWIANSETVRNMTQQHDYTKLMENLYSGLVLPDGTKLNYGKLASYQNGKEGDPRVMVDRRGEFPHIFIGKFGRLSDDRGFTAADETDLFEGTYHCAPASAAVMMTLWSKRMGFEALGPGKKSETEYIHDFAVIMGTNGLGRAADSTYERINFGTLGRRVKEGLTSFAEGKGFKPEIELTTYSTESIKAELDADRPVLISYASTMTRTKGMSHCVCIVGYFYDSEDPKKTPTALIEKDPWPKENKFYKLKLPTSAQTIKGKIPERPSGDRTNTYGDITITDLEDYNPYEDPIDATMITLNWYSQPQPRLANLVQLLP